MCKFLKKVKLLTSLFTDDQVILIASEDSVQKSLHQLSDVTTKYNLTTSTQKSGILAMKGK
jgi:hypothetical protein